MHCGTGAAYLIVADGDFAGKAFSLVGGVAAEQPGGDVDAAVYAGNIVAGHFDCGVRGHLGDAYGLIAGGSAGHGNDVVFNYGVVNIPELDGRYTVVSGSVDRVVLDYDGGVIAIGRLTVDFHKIVEAGIIALAGIAEVAAELHGAVANFEIANAVVIVVANLQAVAGEGKTVNYNGLVGIERAGILAISVESTGELGEVFISSIVTVGICGVLCCDGQALATKGDIAFVGARGRE